eukprot:TRINITY_DN18877_c0_g1_i1.p1 TRINITY_DN18877_c0_g1~~TRINITY_DN18877_c0_g1_i1.p1  ORF type:complete len:347 (-),score=96.45 TRINITY_DN18877_c0_g1_i1:148-1146(-)
MAAHQPVRLCHVGEGRIGKMRLSLFAKQPQHVQCVAMVEPDRGNALWTAQPRPSYATAPLFETIAQASATVRFDAVWISCPTAHHPAAIAEATKFTRFIYCEKPIALTAEKVRECYALCKEKGVELLCGWMRRFDRGYAALHKQVLDTPITIAAAHLVSKDWPHVPKDFLKSLGSIFQDLMCHDFNLACLFMGEETPVSVEAHGKDTTGIGIWDEASCILEYRGGRYLYLEAARFSDTRKYENYLQVITPTGKVLETGRETDCFTFMERYEAAFSAEVPYFASLVREERVQRKSTPASCALTALLVDLAGKSATSGKRIRLDGMCLDAAPKL